MTIKDMRNKLGLTQHQFAERYNIPFRTIQNWENGYRNPPEYVSQLIEKQVLQNTYNSKTYILPKYDSKKIDLPKKTDFDSSIEWLQAIKNFINEDIIFALDEALMCQGLFQGRNNDFIIWAYGNDTLTKYNGIAILGNSIDKSFIQERYNLKFTNLNRTIIDAIDNENILDYQGITEGLSSYYYSHHESLDGLFIPPIYEESFKRILDDAIDYYND